MDREIICDLYTNARFAGVDLNVLKILDRSFLGEFPEKFPSFLGVNISRIDLVSVVIAMRGRGLNVFSVPVIYRDSLKVSLESAYEIAIKHSEVAGCRVSLQNDFGFHPPVVWRFSLEDDAGAAGGLVMIDRCDGHIWTARDHYEYMYDCNAIV
ncbi:MULTISPECIES: hypothetical protein [Xanthomonas]|uniref:hypothetical protein n=1 Tax=Xanthomonas TaxID=338 RepID=UPI001C478C8E|nr:MULTISPECIES: hypothetical protein [Xanthomonas]MBV6830429.1 hypothetical protein [Xanthomonas campestris pv. viegasii]MBV6852138.1 hypothetical protein [Xanthomonas campestris pv. mirabilis]MCC4589458.1 hypothetical protein [Xanthomonas sp. NCPPB 1067]MCP3049475.1 hypothetical protein [Xanthomonas euvesicatoria pv. allii]